MIQLFWPVRGKKKEEELEQTRNLQSSRVLNVVKMT
jgi:hypothetical protein